MPLPILMFVALTPFLFWAFFTWDSLVKLEYEKFHQQWIEDGQPAGMFWRPSKPRPTFRSGMASQMCMLVWLFKNPEWAEMQEEALKLLKRYRVLVLTWNLGIIAIWFLIAVVGYLG